MNEFLQNLLYAVITAGLPVIIGYGVSYLKAKRDQKLQDIDNTYVKETILDATNIVIDAVKTVAQTYVDDLKKTGKFTVEEQKIALEKAIEQAKLLLTLDTTNLVIQKYNDLDAWIKTVIEAYIKTTK
jgi:hypothetical protein